MYFHGDYVSLNALSGIGGVQTPRLLIPNDVSKNRSLNALSGIGGVQTEFWRKIRRKNPARVLMPCRALEAFRQ